MMQVLYFVLRLNYVVVRLFIFHCRFKLQTVHFKLVTAADLICPIKTVAYSPFEARVYNLYTFSLVIIFCTSNG